ncbi:ferritin [Membranihabitans maritimus]|uniref:ferritin n=1 Tax=Membranihabitans maritimus TaxID=2904244 RepID=UPI001F1907FA|nr:ferritin [Membranihabitans maritimus]
MISKEMQSRLNDQIQKEGNASFLYLSMSAWCEDQGLNGCAKFMRRQSDEEHMHMMKLIDYMFEMDARAIISSIDQPPSEFDDPKSLFEEVLEHEKRVTQSINELVEYSMVEKDHSTYNFLQWYVEEQREEENLMRSILDRISLIGDAPQKLYFIDKELEAINNAVENSEEI